MSTNLRRGRRESVGLQRFGGHQRQNPAPEPHCCKPIADFGGAGDDPERIGDKHGDLLVSGHELALPAVTQLCRISNNDHKHRSCPCRKACPHASRRRGIARHLAAGGSLAPAFTFVCSRARWTTTPHRYKSRDAVNGRRKEPGWGATGKI